MKSKILYLFTRTPLHVGAGSSVGAVDLPIQRERHTGYPVIPGSSIKGVLRDFFETETGLGSAEVLRLFGKADDSGESRSGIAAFGEARLVLFPVRSARGGFAFLTCPLALARLKRDAGIDLKLPAEPSENTCLAGEPVTSKGKVVLEEYAFSRNDSFPSEWETVLSSVMDDAVLNSAGGHFVLLSNGDFAHFALTTCPVNQHVAINDETGTAAKGALFNEETVPSEALFYSTYTAMPRNTENSADLGTLDHFAKLLATETLLQFGGKNTVGLGFTSAILK